MAVRKKDILRAVHDVDRQFFREAQQRAERASQKKHQKEALRLIGKGALITAVTAGAAALVFTGVMVIRSKPGIELSPGSTPSVEQSAGVLNTSEFEPATTAATDTTDQTETVTVESLYPPANESGAGNAKNGVIDGQLAVRGSVSPESPQVSFVADSPVSGMRWTSACSAVSCNSDYLFRGKFRIALTPADSGWNRISRLCQQADCSHSYDTDCPLSGSDPLNVVGIEGGYLLRSGWTFRQYGDDTGNAYTAYWTDETAKQQLTNDPDDRSVLGELHEIGGKWFLIKSRSVTCLGSSIGETEQTLNLPGNVNAISAADCFGSDVWLTADLRIEDSSGSSHIETKLLHWNLETDFYSTALTVNNSLGVCCNHQYVYFVLTQEDAPDGSDQSLCRLPLNGKGKPETVVAHFRCAKAQHWTVTDQSVYYYSNWRYVDTLGKYLRRGSGFGMLIGCNADGGAPHEIPLELYPHDTMQRYTDAERTDICLIDDRSCDSIFLLDLAKLTSGSYDTSDVSFNALFAIRRDTDEVTGCILPDSVW